ncbi:hypothetical protein [Streptomyces sp. NPDC055287]
MSMVAGQTLAAPDLLRLALYFLPDWLRITLGAIGFGLLLREGVRRLRRMVATRGIRPEGPEE